MDWFYIIRFLQCL